MEAHAARFDRKAILPNSCSSWTLQCTEPDCAKGVRPFAPKDDVEGSKFCPSHQELKEQKIVIDRVLANNPGRSSILITTDSWRRYNHYWTLKCEKEGCLNGVGEHISTTNCPKYCDTHRVLENRRVALEAQKAIVEAVLSALPPGRKLVLIKASPAEQVQGLNDFWTLGCGEEDCTNGVGRYINAHNHPKYCTPHLREKREALELEAGKARIDAVVARGDSTRKAKLVSVVGGGSYWTLQCTKSSCSEGVGSYVSMNDVPSLCVSHKAEADLQKLKEGLDERAIKESRVVISVISPETGCNTWTLKCIQAGCDAKEYHMKRCLKHYYSQRNEIAEEQLPIILDKTL